MKHADRSDTMPRSEKGPLGPPPALEGMARVVADIVARWPRVIATVHWHLYDRTRVDGVDFYLGQDELGHIHLDGSIHLATGHEFGRILIAEGRAQRFPYSRAWVQAEIDVTGRDAAVGLFRRNYERLSGFAVHRIAAASARR